MSNSDHTQIFLFSSAHYTFLDLYSCTVSVPVTWGYFAQILAIRRFRFKNFMNESCLISIAKILKAVYRCKHNISIIVIAQ